MVHSSVLKEEAGGGGAAGREASNKLPPLAHLMYVYCEVV